MSAIAGSVVVLAQRSIVDVSTAILAVVTAFLLWKFKQIKEPVVVFAAATIGLVVYPPLH